MYNVSEEYLKAVSKPVRRWKIRAEFNYQTAPQKVFDDSTIIDDPMIESQVVSGSSSCGMIDIGATPCATASLTVIDEGATLRKYAEAEFTMWVSLLLENGNYEDVLMGTFYCDTSKMSRTGSQINVYAYDSMSSLNYTLTEAQREQLDGCTPYQIVTALVKNAKCNFNQYFNFPNQTYKMDLTSTQVRTARDCIMWCAQIMGCFARINRQNYLEFIPIRSPWRFFGDDHTLGTIVSVRDIGHKERYSTRFSDDRIHIVGVSMSDDNNNLVTQRVTGLDDDSNVIIALEKNPLFNSERYSLEYALNSILNQLSTTYFYAFDAEILSDPALDAGDTVRLTGGLINGTNQNNDLIGFITHNIWRYRGRHEIINTGQTPTPSADGIVFDTPRSQTDKLLASLAGKTNDLKEQVGQILAVGGGSGGSSITDRFISGGGSYVFTPVNVQTIDHEGGGSTIATGYGAELDFLRGAAKYVEFVMSDLFTRIKDTSGKNYVLAIGYPKMEFFDYKRGIGFKAGSGDGEGYIELGFGDKLETVTLSKRGKNLYVTGIENLYINEKKVFTTE